LEHLVGKKDINELLNTNQRKIENLANILVV